VTHVLKIDLHVIKYAESQRSLVLRQSQTYYNLVGTCIHQCWSVAYLVQSNCIIKVYGFMEFNCLKLFLKAE
jgi:peptidyl-tRNA hydrolase